MRGALPILAGLGLYACSDGGVSVESFGADWKAAETAVAECDAGNRKRGCDAAREGLAEARRRDRKALYRQAH